METFAPTAQTEIFDLPHIGKDTLKDMREVVGKSFLEKQKLMVEVFNALKKGTTFQVIEQHKNNEDKTDVILRQDSGNGGGIRGPRFPHGTNVELISTPGRKNVNGYSFRTLRDNKGQERIYVHVRINGQEGYMAMEHVGIKDIPVDAKPIPPVVPPIEKPKTTAEPTVDKSEKPKEAPKTTAEPTEDEGKKPKEASKTTAEPTDDGKENEKSTTTAEPTETPEEAGKRMADGILASIRANQNKEEVSKKIGPELISTLNTLNLDQDTQNSINKVLVEQNFNLVLDSGRSLVDFTFDRVNITSDRIGKQEIVNIEVSGKTLIVTLANETSLVFAPPKG